MEEKPGKGKIAAFVAAVVVATGVMSWALYESFKADQDRFEDFTDDSYYGDEYDQLEPEISTAEAPVKPAVPAKPPAKP